MNYLNPKLKSTAIYITSYLTHGYNGLGLAMEEKFTSSYGMGFSTFYRHNSLKIIGRSDLEESIYEKTYMHKINERGWFTGLVWSTFFIFPACAS